MQSIDELEGEELKKFRRNIQMIFQDPYESLNPRWNIKDIILEPLNIHNIGDLKDREDAVYEILKTVGLTPPKIICQDTRMSFLEVKDSEYQLQELLL